MTYSDFDNLWSQGTASAEQSVIGEERRAGLGSAIALSYANLDHILPYDGERNTVRRSTSAKTGMLLGATLEDRGVGRPIGFESSLERACALYALLNPNTYGLKCQPRRVIFKGKVHDSTSNTLDFLLRLKTGERYYLFVKNQESLDRAQTGDIIEAIREMLPEGHGLALISEAAFSPSMRGNLERMFIAKRLDDPEADERLARIAASELSDQVAFTVEELVMLCVTSRSRVEQGRYFDAILRAIADHRLQAQPHSTLDYHSVLRPV